MGVSIRLLKENSDICAPILTSILNSCMKDGIFLDKLRLAVNTPIFDSIVKKNH